MGPCLALCSYFCAQIPAPAISRGSCVSMRKRDAKTHSSPGGGPDRGRAHKAKGQRARSPVLVRPTPKCRGYGGSLAALPPGSSAWRPPRPAAALCGAWGALVRPRGLVRRNRASGLRAPAARARPPAGCAPARLRPWAGAPSPPVRVAPPRSPPFPGAALFLAGLRRCGGAWGSPGLRARFRAFARGPSCGRAPASGAAATLRRRRIW